MTGGGAGMRTSSGGNPRRQEISSHGNHLQIACLLSMVRYPLAPTCGGYSTTFSIINHSLSGRGPEVTGGESRHGGEF